MNAPVTNVGSAMARLKQRGESNPIVSIVEIEIPLAKIKFDATQPRQAFHVLDGRVANKDESYIAELAQTIEQQGLIQAITVKDNEDGTYTVVVGECRTRAHLLLKKQTIRAVVRNDLTDPLKRLLYQLVENVSREDLTEDELAQSITKLKKGSETEPPMTQIQIAKSLGKSEGWVTRFVKFGDEELQRLWVKTGIAPVAENMYRLSLLPTALQVEVVRRVDLPEGHKDRLEKPLSRKVIDAYSHEAKIQKVAAKSPGTPLIPPASSGLSATHPIPGATPLTSVEVAPGTDGQADVVGVEKTELSQVDKELVAMAAEGQIPYSDVPAAPGGTVIPASASDAVVVPQAAYQLAPEARNAILGKPQSSVAVSLKPDEPLQAPVICRVSAVNLMALIEKLKTNEKLRDSLDCVPCTLSFPGVLAQLIANEMRGMIVGAHEVPAVIQSEIERLF